MPKNKLKWRKDGTAKCGPWGVSVEPYPRNDWFQGEVWSIKTGLVEKDWNGTETYCKSAAESWLSRQVEKMRKDLN